MKFKDDEWLTDYINALHFTIRSVQTKYKDEDAADIMKAEADALLQEAILCHVPMEVFDIKRIAARVKSARVGMKAIVTENQSPERESVMETYDGDTRSLISDYSFLRQGFEVFTLRDMLEECSEYLAKTYPDITDIKAAITELFNRDVDMGMIEEIKPGVYQHTSKAPGSIYQEQRSW
ncbi:hypothetical protein QUF80_24340 [Desulfococcaceae bacterium HSG8]|nr:hypothetical protein [Desulfococcaceae bacterium HSG8]